MTAQANVKSVEIVASLTELLAAERAAAPAPAAPAPPSAAAADDACGGDGGVPVPVAAPEAPPPPATPPPQANALPPAAASQPDLEPQEAGDSVAPSHQPEVPPQDQDPVAADAAEIQKPQTASPGDQPAADTATADAATPPAAVSLPAPATRPDGHLQPLAQHLTAVDVGQAQQQAATEAVTLPAAAWAEEAPVTQPSTPRAVPTPAAALKGTATPQPPAATAPQSPGLFADARILAEQVHPLL